MGGWVDGGWWMEMGEWVCDTSSIPEIQKGWDTRKSVQGFGLPGDDWGKEVEEKTFGGTWQAPVAPGLPHSPWTCTQLSLLQEGCPSCHL